MLPCALQLTVISDVYVLGRQLVLDWLLCTQGPTPTIGNLRLQREELPALPPSPRMPAPLSGGCTITSGQLDEGDYRGKTAFLSIVRRKPRKLPLGHTCHLLRVAGSARGGGTAESGQGYMQKMLWACLSVCVPPVIAVRGTRQ